MLKITDFQLIGGSSVQLYDSPNVCPCCHETITPQLLKIAETKIESEVTIYTFFKCPNLYCGVCFSAVYKKLAPIQYVYSGILQPNLKTSAFTDEIKEISPAFTEIFNQAFSAEQYKLLEIAGIGYRKSLEFLVKDYLINFKGHEREEVESKLLKQCIDKWISDPNIKTAAKLATFLGNDQAHYVKRWETKELEDLKILIKITVNMVSNEVLLKKYTDDMTETE